MKIPKLPEHYWFPAALFAVLAVGCHVAAPAYRAVRADLPPSPLISAGDIAVADTGISVILVVRVQVSPDFECRKSIKPAFPRWLLRIADNGSTMGIRP